MGMCYHINISDANFNNCELKFEMKEDIKINYYNWRDDAILYPKLIKE